MREAHERELRAIYESQVDSVFRFLVRYTGDTALAEDLCQETFLRLARSMHRQSVRASPAPWLFRVARNLAVDEFRRRKRRQAYRNRKERKVEAPRHPDQLVHIALSRISPKERELLLLVECSNLGLLEIARAERVSESTLRKRISRARAKFREEYTKLEREEP